jgi:hypothetical protein
MPNTGSLEKKSLKNHQAVTLGMKDEAEELRMKDEAKEL